jgi:hypothetical protein
MSQLKLTSQKGKVLIKDKIIFAVSFIILRSDQSSGHIRRDLSSGLNPSWVKILNGYVSPCK